MSDDELRRKHDEEMVGKIHTTPDVTCLCGAAPHQVHVAAVKS